jgi:hypothetical protein
MKTILLVRAQMAARARKPGYMEALMSKGQQVKGPLGDYLILSDADHAAIGDAFAIIPKPPKKTFAPSPPGQGLGDKLHSVLGPIGRAIHWPCMAADGTTNLKPGSPCDNARKALNNITI